MKALFETVLDRTNTSSLKWDNLEGLFGVDNGRELISMWIADMDLDCPSYILDAVQKAATRQMFGYSFQPDYVYEAISLWTTTRC